MATSKTSVITLWSVEVKIGPGPSPIGAERLVFHKALAKAVVPRSRAADIRATQKSPFTTYSSLSEIIRDPSGIKGWISWPVKRTPELIAVLDLSTNPSQLLRDAHLLAIADAVQELRPSDRDVILIVFPDQLPARSSSFRRALETVGKDTGTRMALVGPSAVEMIGGDEKLVEGLRKAYQTSNREMGNNAAARLERGLIRLIGHFDLGDNECSTDYWDGSMVTEPLTKVIVERLRTWGVKGDKFVLAVPDSIASWMREAVITAAEVLDLAEILYLEARPKLGADQRRRAEGRTVVMCHDVVRTGRSLSWQHTLLVEAGLAVHKKVLCAVAALSADRVPKPLEVAAFSEVKPGRFPRDSCPQCDLRLPFTPVSPMLATSRHIRAFDFWQITTSSEWKQERYGPSTNTRKRLDKAPDFETIIKTYGDWIAYKLERAFHDLGLGSEVVVVSPDEPAMDKLFDPLNLRFRERLVHIAIPRAAFEGKRDVKRAAARRATWARQLLHVADHEQRAVMVDEFNRSGSTAANIYRMLTNVGVRVEGYVPILNNLEVGRTPSLPIPTYALYELPMLPELPI